MNTVALRFGEHFSPECGTIAAHQEIINKLGYVWYGKMGSKVSSALLDNLLKSENAKILLINSGKADRYWAYISAYSDKVLANDEFPQYYADKAEGMKTWFKIYKIEMAPKDIMSKCFVISSGAPLGEVSKHSMSPYFKISYSEEAK